MSAILKLATGLVVLFVLALLAVAAAGWNTRVMSSLEGRSDGLKHCPESSTAASADSFARTRPSCGSDQMASSI